MATMRFLIDFFPILLFFGAYKLHDIYVGTAVLMAATVLQSVLIYAIDRRLQTMQKATLALVLVFGAAGYAWMGNKAGWDVGPGSPGSAPVAESCARYCAPVCVTPPPRGSGDSRDAATSAPPLTNSLISRLKAAVSSALMSDPFEA